jgi:hypothetical protein
MTTPLLKTKLYIPPVRTELVPRPRLIERLNGRLRDRASYSWAAYRSRLAGVSIRVYKRTVGGGPGSIVTTSRSIQTESKGISRVHP